MSVILDRSGTIELASRSAATASLSTRAKLLPLWREYLMLTKPRIAVMGLVTVALGFMLAPTADWSGGTLGHALLGIGLVAASCSVLNQWQERDTDRRMPRTANRPLPAGRLQSGEVLAFGVGLALIGLTELAWFVNSTTMWLSLLTLTLYVGVYTPLKKRTSLCTTVGAIPGAMPPVLGWVAAGGSLDAGAFALFATLFVWQFPHFLAIAWLYRDQYSAAGLRMLPSVPLAPRVVGWMCVGYSLALIPVSLLLKEAALAGDAFAMIASLLGLGYVGFSARFLYCESVRTARHLVWFSLVYLPALLLVLTWDHWRLLS
jgi:protoheme IX farnesyltransferase